MSQAEYLDELGSLNESVAYILTMLAAYSAAVVVGVTALTFSGLWQVSLLDLRNSHDLSH